MLRIIALDPGLITGVVSFTITEEQINCVDSHELDLVGVGNYLESISLTSDTVMAFEVANKFQVSGHLSSEVIGLGRYFSLKAGTEYIPVTQSSHKGLITRDVLKRAGLYVKGTHAKDAAGVGLFVAITRYKLITNVLRQEES